MESVPADAVFSIKIIRKPIQEGVGRHLLMETRIEHSDLGTSGMSRRLSLIAMRLGGLWSGANRAYFSMSATPLHR